MGRAADDDMAPGSAVRPASIAGTAGAAVALGLSELASGLARSIPSLVVAVSDLVVDLAPFGVVEGAISIFGTNDKQALVVGTVVLSLLAGAAIGRASATRPAAVPVAFTAFGVLGLWAASRHHDAAFLPVVIATTLAVVGGVATVKALGLAWRVIPRAPANAPDTGLARRAFLGAVGASVVLASASALAGSRLRRRFRVEEARGAVRLPAAVRSDAPIESAALTRTEGLTPLVTPNDRFYRIDTAILVPQVEPEGWSLKVGGRVDEVFELTYTELLDLPMVEEYVTLACVSNEVGGNLVGNAKWLGVPLAELLDRARPRRDADQIVGRSVDGFTVGFPTEAARDGRTALVAVGMNGEPLPVVHGFPARLVVSGLYGYVSATKWLEEIELTRWDDFDAYWIPRGWAKEAPVKTQSRIDVPRPGRALAPGPTAVAGVAWAPHLGIARVEVRVDEDDWSEAELSADASADTWRQWRWVWDAPLGDHRLSVRATDATGEAQTAERTPPPPDGATGHHTITVRVRPSS